MKHLKKLFIIIELMISLQLFAENKKVAYIFNNYGKDVSVRLVWAPQANSYALYNQYDEFLISKNDSFNDALSDEKFNKKFQYKAPYSQYYLQNITVIPAANTWGHTNFQVGVNASTAIPSAIIKTAAGVVDVGVFIVTNSIDNTASSIVEGASAFWEASLDKNEVVGFLNESDKESIFIIIENNGKKSSIPGQKQIDMSILSSKDSCEKHILNKNVHKLIEQNT